MVTKETLTMKRTRTFLFLAILGQSLGALPPLAQAEVSDQQLAAFASLHGATLTFKLGAPFPGNPPQWDSIGAWLDSPRPTATFMRQTMENLRSADGSAS